MQLLVTGGEAAIARPGFAEYVAGLVSRGMAVYLTATSPHVLVNEHLQPTVAAGAYAGHDPDCCNISTACCMTAREGKGVLRTLPHLYRLQLEKWRAFAKKYSN